MANKKLDLKSRFLISTKYYPYLISIYLILTNFEWLFDLFYLLAVLLLISIFTKEKRLDILIGPSVLLITEMFLKHLGFRQIYPYFLMILGTLGVVMLFVYFKDIKSGAKFVLTILSMIILLFVIEKTVNYFLPEIYFQLYRGVLIRALTYTIPLVLLGKVIQKDSKFIFFIYSVGLIPFWFEWIIPGGFQSTVSGLMIRSIYDVRELNIPAIHIPAMYIFSYSFLLLTCYLFVPLLLQRKKTSMNFLFFVCVTIVGINIIIAFLFGENDSISQYIFSFVLLIILLKISQSLSEVSQNKYPHQKQMNTANVSRKIISRASMKKKE